MFEMFNSWRKFTDKQHKKNIQNIFCSLKEKKGDKGGGIETVFEKNVGCKNFKIDEKH